ncbi:MAG: DUF427 domain-containing protein [Rhizobiaceae bacterium]|jgi:uncharacterized protein (DUF427 family)|nr:DUF427 domain-containing protein [Rhizobiaceae bacterium]
MQNATALPHIIENVRDYPRPPRLEPFPRPISARLGGVEIVNTRAAWRVLETFHAPTYYLPPDAFAAGVLVPAQGGSTCEWKGRARYFDLVAGGKRASRAAWAYDDPTPDFRPIAGFVAFYAFAVDEVTVDGEPAMPQPGNFYGGWVNSWITGPIKGAPGTTHW